MAIKRQQSIREVKAAERSEQALALTRQTLQKKAKKSRRAHFLVLDPVLTAVGLTVGALAVALIFVPSGNPSTCIGDPDDSIEAASGMHWKYFIFRYPPRREHRNSKRDAKKMLYFAFT